MNTKRTLGILAALLSAWALSGCNGDTQAENPEDSATAADNTDLETNSDHIGVETEEESASGTADTSSDEPSATSTDTQTQEEETDSCDALLASQTPPVSDDNPISALLRAQLPPPGDDTTDSDIIDTSGSDTGGSMDTATASETEEPLEGGLAGWNILAPGYPKNNNLDLLSFEWDYFMIHDKDGKFTGSIGYLIANPRHSTIFIPGLSELVPAGGNTAVAGKFEGGALLANYHNFKDNYQASGLRRSFEAKEPDSEIFSALIPDPMQNALLLQGQTENFAWDLVISQEWPELTAIEGDGAFEPMTGRDVGANSALSVLGGEVWTVNMLWPRTKVVGTITDLSDPLSPVTVDIDGHGYRENSHGRWAFNAGGWDFGIVSDEEKRVMWTWQSYHHASTKLDYADVAFYDNEQLVIAHFDAKKGEVGWFHDDWKFDAAARQCMPQNTEVRAVNGDYIIEASLTIDENQVAMLSDATPATRAYVIEIQFPKVTGTIKRRSTGETITAFAGQGGGEFSVSRQPASVTQRSDEWCYCWGYNKFSSSMPSP
ncbi:MAG: hypothetical protein MUC50_01105 [Myxococcota bacterium]|jgi:hypothetical protein|nr:hypothetical protein [Myxococcota bacterium]